MSTQQEPYGILPDGRAVERWTLRRGRLVVRFITYGGTITDILQPGRDGTVANVVLGCPDLAGYVGRPGEARPYFGALIGRFANRIAGARFTLDGVEHRLSANEGANCLHGGADGFDRQVWTVEPGPEAASAILRHTSPDGSNGFPGTLSVEVTYALSDDDELRIHYVARSDRRTVVNLTNHSYFNLAGAGTIDRHLIAITAGRFLPIGPGSIPSGPPRTVRGTPFDLRAAAEIGSRLGMPDEQLLRGRGFDHCWLLDQPAQGPAVRVHDPVSERWLTCRTDQPALQFYTGNFLDGSVPGRSGAGYRQGAGLALEAQHCPDSPNRPEFPSTVLEPDLARNWTTVFAFGCGASPPV